MFTLSDTTGIVFKSDSGFIIKFGDGEPSFPSMKEKADSSFDELGSNLRTIMELDKLGHVKSFSGSKSYKERNTYGQTIFDGKLGEDERAVIIGLGDQIDLSDSTLIYVNIEPGEAWAKLMELGRSHRDSLKKKDQQRALSDFVGYAEGKNGIVHEEKAKKGLLGGLFSRKG